MDLHKRIKKVLTVSILLLTVGVIYTIVCFYTSFRVPCVFYLVTGLKCPGCGVTGMCLSLLKFDFQSAFLYNRVLFFMSPVGAVIAIHYIYRYIKYGDRMLTKPSRAVVIAMIIILLIFTVVRNILKW